VVWATPPRARGFGGSDQARAAHVLRKPLGAVVAQAPDKRASVRTNKVMLLAVVLVVAILVEEDLIDVQVANHETQSRASRTECQGDSCAAVNFF
jgi:hypothetical protein